MGCGSGIFTEIYQSKDASDHRRVVNNLTDGKAKGVDGWSPAELRALSRSHIKGLTDLLNNIEKYQRWPHGLHPIIALIAEEGAENEGQLRPIAIL
eukprot:4308074-Heterocapsa_arctica.AAC.1